MALITKGMTVSMFYDLMTKTDYNVLDSTVRADKMLRTLNRRQQDFQDECFDIFDYWMTLDVENSHEEFTADIQDTKLLRTLKSKYQWIHSISNEKSSSFQQNITISTVTSNTEREIFAKAEDEEIATFLLAPNGIRKWLYQINFLIVGRRDSQFNAHKPLLFVVMNKYEGQSKISESCFISDKLLLICVVCVYINLKP